MIILVNHVCTSLMLFVDTVRTMFACSCDVHVRMPVMLGMMADAAFGIALMTSVCKCPCLCFCFGHLYLLAAYEHTRIQTFWFLISIFEYDTYIPSTGMRCVRRRAAAGHCTSPRTGIVSRDYTVSLVWTMHVLGVINCRLCCVCGNMYRVLLMPVCVFAWLPLCMHLLTSLHGHGWGRATT